jgi:hypothetical protein
MVMMKKSQQEGEKGLRQPRRENDSETLCSVAGIHAYPCTRPEQRELVFASGG